MPYRYFGFTNQHFGKPLWEIVMNLKNFGIGRLVTKSAITAANPNVPSFYRIVAVHPHLLEKSDTFTGGNIFVEEVFCGRKRAEIIDIGTEAGVSDYKLVPRADEGEILRAVQEFLANPENHKPIVRPRTAQLPPVWREIIARERNIAYEDVPEIPIVYEDIDPEIKPPSRLAEENETPDFKVGPGNFKPVHDELYEHVIWNREAAREKYVNVPPPPPDYIKAPGKYLKPLHLEKKPKSTSAATN